MIQIHLSKLDYQKLVEMAKYTELQTRKLISSYGGVGSIIETVEGALIIKDFDKWKYFYLIEKGKIEVQENENINDDRLLNRLKFYFPELNQIVKVPANYSAFYNTSLPKLKDHKIAPNSIFLRL